MSDMTARNDPGRHVPQADIRPLRKMDSDSEAASEYRNYRNLGRCGAGSANGRATVVAVQSGGHCAALRQMLSSAKQ
jgi:hypothetical protein